MTDAEWNAYIEAEKQAFAHFHSLRKYNSSRRARQEAWAKTQWYLQRRRSWSHRAHPIAPDWRWYDFQNTAPEGWTWPAKRTLEDAEVDEMFPGARQAAFSQLSDIHYRFIYEPDYRGGGKLRTSVPKGAQEARRGNATWLPEVGLWRRYMTFVKSKPYRKLEGE